MSTLLASLTPMMALLQEHAPEAEGGLLTLHGGLMVWTLVIFIILLFVLSKYAFGPITAAVRAREQALEDAIAGAKRDREEAAKLLEDHRKQLDASRGESQKLIADARAAAERVRTDLVEQAHQQQTEMLQRARTEIEAEKQRAIAEMRHEAVELAIAAAEKVIERNLDEQSNRKLVESFLASIAPRTVKS
jgi:F-type H+-transporting ATPase subunit b